MKRLTLFFLGVAACLTVSTALFFSSCTGGVSSTSESYIFAEKLKAGWNLGNTLDAQNEGAGKKNLGLSTETSWGQPLTTQEMIHAIREKGFSTIRIPVSWHNHIADANLTIDPDWMNRVKEIVGWVLDEGLYVIINIHHDNLKDGMTATSYGFTVNTDPEEFSASMEYITAVWRQVAEAFIGCDEHLIFELLNEPRHRQGNDEGFGTPGNLTELNRLITRYCQSALNAIRETGGNNAGRYVMAPCYAASPYDMLRWKLPKDTAESRLLVSVHAYTPYEFCMSTTKDSTFENGDEGSDINYLCDMLESDWVSRGFGVVMGETSASDKNNTAERFEWFDYYCRKAKECGIPVILWDNNSIAKESGGYGDIQSGECHGYFKRSDCTWYFPTLVEKMIEVLGSAE